jgi:chromosome segregation ATPase
VIALMAATAYSFYQVNQLRGELAETKDLVAAEVGKIVETTDVSTRTGRASMDTLKAEVEAARVQASRLAGQAQADANKHADELAEQLQRAQQEQSARIARETAKLGESVNAVSAEVSQARQENNVTGTRVTEVSTNLASVKSVAEATKSELEKTIAELTTTRGDLGVQSGLIATNSKQLQALRALGERNYVEFSIKKAKTSQKVGDLQIRLTNADVKKNRYTVEVIVDDKKVEKKDRTVNEPVQFVLSRSVTPYELVVNEVKKDLIAGYLSTPKVQQSRTASN